MISSSALKRFSYQWSCTDVSQSFLHVTIARSGQGHEIVRTFDRLCIIGIATTTTCPLCQANPEMVDHHFFQYAYLQQVLQLAISSNSFPTMELSSVLQKTDSNLVRSNNFKFLLCATIYYIWFEWNFRKYESTLLSPFLLA